MEEFLVILSAGLVILLTFIWGQYGARRYNGGWIVFRAIVAFVITYSTILFHTMQLGNLKLDQKDILQKDIYIERRFRK